LPTKLELNSSPAKAFSEKLITPLFPVFYGLEIGPKTETEDIFDSSLPMLGSAK
tara:strand:- start:122331 stop:122492 length:162 start_codon:yes stop_codon:yes gene_type:complete